ncbi:hypothetical protein IFT48_03100 [Pseudomonas fluorescens]|uniref:hypothetical protein n=1 Tax=Pseudomonas fluorescens TaxID=294 RepID=UPI001930E234|nr:hypothetical protein [Pseudomonas fluorescens]MBD8088955.1 hypothetical protein [Pseudomonas fluorescens]
MKILITGARSYVAYYWGLALKAKHEIIYCDSLSHPYSRYAPFASTYIKVAPPAQDSEGFKRDIQTIVLEQGIEMVIPTCEEVFYLASFAEEMDCQVFCPDFALLADLHHKHHVFTQLPENTGVRFPETRPVFNAHDVMRNAATILKPAFSRFGSKVIMDPGAKDLSVIDGKQPWVQQEKLIGRNLCSYAVAVNGKMVAYSCYHARFSIENSAALALSPVHYKQIEAFNKAFIEQHQYNGQVAFDFIEDEVEGGVYVIECNPRGTSGIHLLNLEDLQAAVFESGPETRTHQSTMAFKPILSWYNWIGKLGGGYRANLKEQLTDCIDILAPEGEPKVSRRRWLLMFEMGWRMLRHGTTLAQSTTYDIEWNGQALAVSTTAPMETQYLGEKDGVQTYLYGLQDRAQGAFIIKPPYAKVEIKKTAEGDWMATEGKRLARKIVDQMPRSNSSRLGDQHYG